MELTSIEQETYLGIVTWKGRRGSHSVALLQPLSKSSPDGGRWEDPLSNSERLRLFPNGGSVSWLFAGDDVLIDSIWQFRVTAQPTYDERPTDPRRDRYMTVPRSEKPVPEVFDVDGLGGEPTGRERLCHHGISVLCVHKEHNVLRVESNLWGFVPFTEMACEEGKFVISPSFLDKPIRLQRCASAVEVQELTVKGARRFFLTPNAKIEGSPAHRDWSPDITVLKRCLSRLNKWDRAYSDMIGLSSKALDRLAELFSSQTASINDFDMEQARFERAKTFLSRCTDSDLFVSAARSVLENGSLSEEIERQKIRIVEEETIKAKDSVQASINTEKEVLAKLRSEVATIEIHRARLEAENVVAQQQRQSSIDSLEFELEARLQDLLERPQRALADVAIMQAIARIIGKDQQVPIDQSRQDLPSVDEVVSGVSLELAPIVDLTKYGNSFQKELIWRDTPRILWRAIHTSLIGGGIPLTSGARARQAFEAFAEVTTRGEIHWIQVEPTWTAQRQMLEGELGDVLWRHRDDSHLQLIVLEGVDRAPVEAYLDPLLKSYECAWDEQSSRRLQLQRRRKNNDSTFNLHQLSWPKHVLLGGTMMGGVTSLGLPSSCLSFFNLIMTDEIKIGAELDLLSNEHPALRRRSSTSAVKREVPISTWLSWREAAITLELELPIKHWNELVAAYGLSRLGRDRFLSTFAAARLSTDEENCALADSLAYAALPLIAAIRDDYGFDVDSNFAYEDIEKAMQALRKLIKPS